MKVAIVAAAAATGLALGVGLGAVHTAEGAGQSFGLHYADGLPLMASPISRRAGVLANAGLHAATSHRPDGSAWAGRATDTAATRTAGLAAGR